MPRLGGTDRLLYNRHILVVEVEVVLPVELESLNLLLECYHLSGQLGSACCFHARFAQIRRLVLAVHCQMEFAARPELDR